MNQLVTKISDPNVFLHGEWLVTNGLGGFACSSICFAPHRKHHALLIAALPVPLGRTIMLNYVSDILILPDKREFPLSHIKQTSQENIAPPYLKEFRLEDGLPVWRYEIEDIVLEKSLILIHRQNTLHMSYKLLACNESSLSIKWRPYFHFRTYEQPVNFQGLNESYTIHSHNQHYEIEFPSFPTLRLYNYNQAPFSLESHKIENILYEIEAKRGYESVGGLTSPGYYMAPLVKEERTTFIASTESWKIIHILPPDEAVLAEKQRRKKILKASKIAAQSEIAAKLILAADQFIMTPITREEDHIRLQASGEEALSIIAGFPWFTDWGRDTMISLEGITMTTGQARIAHSILRTFAHYIKNGLIPNMFPDGENEAIYNTADASLWFFHAIDRYIETSGDEDILEILLPKLRQIIDHHKKGTLFGIHVDEDGLLTQGQKGVQLTWMDAKVGDWVVTPRRGKAVEINALWYNALKLFETWTKTPHELTQLCYESFNKRFWYEPGQHLYDVIDGENGDDYSLRPNQIFAISLRHPILEEKRWKSVLDVTRKELLTPFGMRTLSPAHPDYKAFYDGDLSARDAAYHQGTVWPWLLGPFIDAWLKVYPDDFATAQQFLKGLEGHLDSNCLGTIAEIFDANDPHHARGCFAQAWSVAELLRCLVKVHPNLFQKQS
jgi:predicted glycogen debranching enzyme